MNKNYMGYTPGTTTENVGVTIRFIQEPHAIDGHWYYCGQGCFQGYCDCRVSASLLNHKVMIDVQNGTALPLGTLGTDLGVVFDQTLVESTLGKCYYPYDGGTDRRYNQGCGCGMLAQFEDCKSPQSAYKSIDPATGKPMTAKSKDVHDCMCDGGARAGNPTKHTDAQCYWTGPAFFPNATNQISQMLDHRMHDQQVGDVTETTYWNEVVIDGVVMEAEMKKDPSKVVKAVVWLKKGNGDLHAYQAAQQMSQYFGSHGFSTAPPIIAFDTKQDVMKCGPFSSYHPGAAVTV
jgi:hypothetical protein